MHARGILRNHRMGVGGRVLITALALCWGATTPAATLYVTQCGDSGAGSLRDAIAHAADGDAVDASGLACTSVLLTSGQIEVPQQNLHLTSATGLAIIAQDKSRVLHHSGKGTLRITRLHLMHGRTVGRLATGGCLHSNGHVELDRLTVSECTAVAEGTGAIALGGGVHATSLHAHRVQFLNNIAAGEDSHGGGISTEGRTSLLYSRVAGNRAHTGGGIFALGGVSLTYARIENNRAYDVAGVHTSGHVVTVTKSSITHNRATHRCGGICASPRPQDFSRLMDSTISSNEARFLAAGEFTDFVRLENSTVAFNHDRSTLECVGAFHSPRLALISTLLAQNRCDGPGPAYDVGGRPWEGDSIVGTTSLIRHSRLPVPPDTLNADPRLDPVLGLNGGTHSLLHALQPDSPAIDRGFDSVTGQYDQRGPGFPRLKGVQTDIGAYEY